MGARSQRYSDGGSPRFYLGKNCFNLAVESIRPFSKSLSAVLAYHLGSKTPLDYDARKWLAIFGGQLQLDEPKVATVNALTVLQAADNRVKMLNQDHVLREWIGPNLPLRDPTNRQIAAKEHLIRSCPQAWCSCGAVITLTGRAGLVRRPSRAG